MARSVPLNGGFRAHRRPLPSGTAGLQQTVDQMRDEIRRAGRDVYCRQLAEKVVRNAVPGDYLGEVDAVYQWACGIEAPPYRLDPVDAELVRSTLAGVVSKGNDCDDFVVLCGGILESIGHSVRVVTADHRVGKPGPPSHHHTYLEVQPSSRGPWLPFDPVARLRHRDADPGFELPIKHKSRWPLEVRPMHRSRRFPTTVTFSGLYLVEEDETLGKGPFDFLSQFDPTWKNSKFGGVTKAALDIVNPGISSGLQAAADIRKNVQASTGVDLAKVASDIAVQAVKKNAPPPAPVMLRPVSTMAAAPLQTYAPPAPVQYAPPAPVAAAPAGMSTGAKVGLAALGLAAVVGIGVAVARR